MAERPILFSGPMVRALLDGAKTQTRRVMKPTPICELGTVPSLDGIDPKGRVVARCKKPGMAFSAIHRCPYGQPGDHLWVRETFYCDDFRYPEGPRVELLRLMEYRADHDCAVWEAGCPCADYEGRGSWRPSIHMPRWASRITLEVTEVRVERVQDISEDDARAEGVSLDAMSGSLNGEPATIHPFTHRVAFGFLWDSINAKRGYSWERNPWVWVVSFRMT